MRYLVTGGAGFIGSTLVNRLSKTHEVIVVDNLSTGNIDYVSMNSNVTFIQGDVTDSSVFEKVGKVDGIFHLAAMSKVLPSLGDPKMIDFCTHQNVNGTIQVLKFALSHEPPVKVVYSASSTCYGMNPVPQHEGQLPDCQTPYALSKYCGELYCEMYSRLYNVPTIRLRYFMVFGPNEPATGSYAIVSGIFLKRKRENLPLLIHGDGSQTRDFVHVEDVCTANILAMESDLYNETMNVGTGRRLSIKDLANSISDNQVHTEKRQVDLEATESDNSKLQRLLNWTPQMKIEDYVQSIV
jgi:nucleoside-diphosphate-sugar epimerase